MAVAVNPLGEELGAEILNVDLRVPLTAADSETVNQAILDYIVVVFRDQRLTPSQYVEAMRQFGALAHQNHSEQLLKDQPEIWVLDSRNAEVAPDGRKLVSGANCWHSDHLNQQLPPKFTALLAQRLPPTGGDTLFLNGYRLFERLPEETRARVRTMSTVNGADRHLKRRAADAGAFAQPAVHPLVRTHPQTGRQSLYCHPLKMQYIEGMDPEASYRFVDELMERAVSEVTPFRHQWREGDLVVIDNRACMHMAARDYDPDFGRVMHRVIVEGDRPV